MAHGASIRLSTMDLSILSKNKVSLVTLDEKYLPIAIVLPFEGHPRQSKLNNRAKMVHRSTEWKKEKSIKDVVVENICYD